MSILDKNKIDGIGNSMSDKKIALLIADHLDWENELQHLTLLQDKVNAYVFFIESGQIYNVCPDAEFADGYIVDFQFKYKPTDNCYKLLEVFRQNTLDLRIEFKVTEI